MLNRPKALNALSGEMCRQISEVLMGWADDDQVHHVLITGALGLVTAAVLTLWMRARDVDVDARAALGFVATAAFITV